MLVILIHLLLNECRAKNKVVNSLKYDRRKGHLIRDIVLMKNTNSCVVRDTPEYLVFTFVFGLIHFFAKYFSSWM